MAEDEDETRATMEMGEQLRTWRLFLSLAKWHILGLGLLLLLLLAFRTHS
ncbi:hypothetical protein FHS83_001920 [Rhizomicrobium palustre]|jgi:hypothetical protein|uniref:Uncharacterized protein n=1 Tax=Rhizomicrobium palustre TaxID=189966 RepID=A0A846N018_9PROT|nr:hypothetical protein [Rhizomicrobium palustre]NIK88602.1 hypothetical protein [Rhizomicrobium palustre]